jgi:hypothetical protein
MSTVGKIKKNKIEAARMRRVVRGAKKMGIPLPGHGKNTPTASVEKLKAEVEAIMPYWKGV